MTGICRYLTVFTLYAIFHLDFLDSFGLAVLPRTFLVVLNVVNGILLAHEPADRLFPGLIKASFEFLQLFLYLSIFTMDLLLAQTLNNDILLKNGEIHFNDSLGCTLEFFKILQDRFLVASIFVPLCVRYVLTPTIKLVDLVIEGLAHRDVFLADHGFDTL